METATAEGSRGRTACLERATLKEWKWDDLTANSRRLVQHEEVVIAVENTLGQINNGRRGGGNGLDTSVLLDLGEAVGKVDRAGFRKVVSGTETHPTRDSPFQPRLLHFRSAPFLHVHLLLPQFALNQRVGYLRLKPRSLKDSRVLVTNELVNACSNIAGSNLVGDAPTE